MKARQPMCFLTVSRQTVSGSAPPQHPPSTISWTLFSCSLWGVKQVSSKPCLETFPCHFRQTPSAGHCLDTAWVREPYTKQYSDSALEYSGVSSLYVSMRRCTGGMGGQPLAQGCSIELSCKAVWALCFLHNTVSQWSSWYHRFLAIRAMM